MAKLKQPSQLLNLSPLQRWLLRRLTDAGRRITGLSVLGIQWEYPGPSERDIVRRLLTNLEDRRILFDPAPHRVIENIEASIDDIRGSCTDSINEISEHSFAIPRIRMIRYAGRRLLTELSAAREIHDREQSQNQFFSAVATYRAIVTDQIYELAKYYEIEIEGELESVLPKSKEVEEP